MRQGDTDSGYLFNLVMGPLTSQILQSKVIPGIPMTVGSEVRLSQYADDLIVFSKAEPSSIKGVLDELGTFTEVSGLRVNIEKTKCLQIGRNVDTTFLNGIGLNVVNELKVLGILYNSSNRNIVTINIQEILPKISQEIMQWKRRNLTLVGKTVVVQCSSESNAYI